MFNYIDDIHFVGIQLDHMYGKENWPWRLCAELIGCSNATVRKYYKQDWNFTPDQVNIIKKALKALDYKNNEIKFLTPQTHNYWIDGHMRVHKMEKINPVMSAIKCEEKTLELKHRLSDKYEIQWPNASGLYLLAQVICITSRPNEKYFIIKVGKSQNLAKRIQSYRGMNPFATCIDTLEIVSNRVDETEIKYHMMLSKRYERQLNTEWYIVSEEEFEKIVKNGFDAL